MNNKTKILLLIVAAAGIAVAIGIIIRNSKRSLTGGDKGITTTTTTSTGLPIKDIAGIFLPKTNTSGSWGGSPTL